MKRILSLLATLIAIFFSFQANSQTPISTDSLNKDIKGNIVFIGIEHSGFLFEETKNGGLRKSTLISDTSGMYLCSVYPEIIKASKGKRIAFMMEGLRPLKWIGLDSGAISRLRFPNCLMGDTMIGCDTRSDPVKIQSVIVMDLLTPIYDDGMDGTEKTLEEAFSKYSTVDLSKLKSEDVQYFKDWSKVAGNANIVFENYALGVARELEKKGYFIVIVCGAAHVAKIIAEDPIKDLGYVICLNPNQIKSTIRMGKLLMVLEMIAMQR